MLSSLTTEPRAVATGLQIQPGVISVLLVVEFLDPVVTARGSVWESLSPRVHAAAPSSLEAVAALHRRERREGVFGGSSSGKHLSWDEARCRELPRAE